MELLATNVKEYIINYIDVHGYQKQKTAQQVRQALLVNGAEFNVSTDLGIMLEQELEMCDDWVNNLRGESDWCQHAREVWNKDDVTVLPRGLDDIPILCSVISIAKENQKTNAALNDVNNRWAGEVGDKITFTISEDEFRGTHEVGSYHWAQTAYSHYFKGTNGIWYSALTYEGTELVPGDEISGTIKDLEVDRQTGRRITRLTRIRKTGHRQLTRLRFGA